MGFNVDRKIMLVSNLTTNLPVLRAKLGITQTELANTIEITRQTLNSAESDKREMSWVTFAALILLFDKNEDTKILFDAMGIYTKELDGYFKFRNKLTEEQQND